MQYYPIFLNLEGRRCIVIGGGHVAEGKVRALLEAGAKVTVIAPRLTDELRQWADAGRIAHLPREFREGDLDDAFVVVSATDDRTTNDGIWQEASARQVLINVVDDPPHCNFIAPSVVRRGDLAIAISTSGRAPALAVRLREKLELMIGDEYAHFLELAADLRSRLVARYPNFEKRKAIWYELVDSDILSLLREGDEPAARRRIAEITRLGDMEYAHRE